MLHHRCLAMCTRLRNCIPMQSVGILESTARIDHTMTVLRGNSTDHMQAPHTMRPICCGWSHEFACTTHPFAHRLISRRYLELLIAQVRSPSRPLASLTLLIGLHLIPYHEFFASQVFRSSVWPIPPVKAIADLNEGSPPRPTNHCPIVSRKEPLVSSF